MKKAGKPLKIFLVAEDEKCGCCNWEVERLFLVASSEEEAKELYKENTKEGGGALCAECIVDLLMETDTKLLW